MIQGYLFGLFLSIDSAFSLQTQLVFLKMLFSSDKMSLVDKRLSFLLLSLLLKTCLLKLLGTIDCLTATVLLIFERFFRSTAVNFGCQFQNFQESI